MRALLAVGALALAGCATASAGPPASAVAAEAPADVEVVRDGERWTATFRLPRDRPAWAFIRSPVADHDRRP